MTPKVDSPAPATPAADEKKTATKEPSVIDGETLFVAFLALRLFTLSHFLQMSGSTADSSSGR